MASPPSVGPWAARQSAAGPGGQKGALEELARQGGDARSFGRARLAAIGPATAARLRQSGLRADLVPKEYVAEEIVAQLQREGVLPPASPAEDELSGVARSARPGGSSGGPRFLLARAEQARVALAEQLRTLGAHVTELTAYRTVLETEGHEEALAALAAGTVDAVTFTSSSTARHFTQILGRERLRAALAAPRVRCFSIGPITSATMRELGLPVHGEAQAHDIPWLVRLLEAELRS
jgi:uroporphyrinogen III methyltransferase/synthase